MASTKDLAEQVGWCDEDGDLLALGGLVELVLHICIFKKENIYQDTLPLLFLYFVVLF